MKKTHYPHPSPEQHPTFAVIKSPEHFRVWFLSHHDFTIFTESEIEAYFEEASPSQYPCIPYYDDSGSSFPSTYISLEILQDWVGKIQE